MTERMVIVGAGQAGAQAAVSMRQAKYDGEIILIGAEAHLPYQRPPLSKAYLKGEMDAERLFLRPRTFFETQNITLCLNDPAAEVLRDEKVVKTSSGVEQHYDKLLLATGAPPRKISCPGAGLSGVHYLRSLDHSDGLRGLLSVEGRVVIIGAGYIGLEVAAVLRAAGRDVVLVEMAPRVLARVASEPVSSFYEQLHETAGVQIRRGTAVEGIAGAKNVEGVIFGDGETLDCVAVLVGIGAVPEVALAKEAGLDIDNGIVVDDHGRTSDPSIYAAGDCTNFPSTRYGRRMRLESVPNAIEQAKAAGANMVGGDVVYDALPWFWSDQYDVKLQTVGLSEGYDSLVVRGAPEENKFSVWYLKKGAVLAVDAINDPASFAMAKKAIIDGFSIDTVRLHEVTPAELKDLIFAKIQA